jgi:hypothetical protein
LTKEDRQIYLRRSNLQLLPNHAYEFSRFDGYFARNDEHFSIDIRSFGTQLQAVDGIADVHGMPQIPATTKDRKQSL